MLISVTPLNLCITPFRVPCPGFNPMCLCGSGIENVCACTCVHEMTSTFHAVLIYLLEFCHHLYWCMDTLWCLLHTIFSFVHCLRFSVKKISCASRNTVVFWFLKGFPLNAGYNRITEGYTEILYSTNGFWLNVLLSLRVGRLLLWPSFGGLPCAVKYGSMQWSRLI